MDNEKFAAVLYTDGWLDIEQIRIARKAFCAGAKWASQRSRHGTPGVISIGEQIEFLEDQIKHYGGYDEHRDMLVAILAALVRVAE